MKTILMVISTKNFRDEEYFHPKQVFENRGFRVVTTSYERMSTSKFGQRVSTDVMFVDVQTEKYDAVVFVGGAGASIYFNDARAHDLCRAFSRAGKPTAAICIAPVTLANAGVLAGKQATCFESEAPRLKEKGAEYTGAPVTVDGMIVTANGPKAAKDFGEAISKLLLN
ncbi:DJ-1/PfpI family protein [Candidatus Micrarchaeota archaeon]|nr:DJ-1/PfpI family protein [Candidatus Micrarchaeota archaeon]